MTDLIRKSFLVLLFLVVAGCSSQEDILWEEVQKEKTAIAYLDYLDEFPEGEYAATATVELEKITKLFAEKENTVESYQTYLKRFPTEKFSEEARNRLEERMIAKAREKDLEKFYHNYLDEFPEGKYAEESTAFIEAAQLEKEQVAKQEKARRQEEANQRKAKLQQANASPPNQGVRFENPSNILINVCVSGKTANCYTVSPGGSRNLELPVGEYTVEASSNQCNAYVHDLLVVENTSSTITYRCQ